MKCPKCSFKAVESYKFCPECATSLTERVTLASTVVGERKFATIFFSDLSGYSEMTEKFDPEKIQSLMTIIFKESERIIEKYDGRVESLFGDEVMASFGIPNAHEDDPIRAIYACLEIHKSVQDLSFEFKNINPINLMMHTGINSGLVITGDKYIGNNRYGLTGNALNIAKRLTSLAKPGEIIVGQDTHKTAVNNFFFESRAPVQIKGNKLPIKTFRVVDVKTQPKRTKQLHGVRADLIGRDSELIKFGKRVKALKAEKGSVVCLCGYAGTGKSRLMEEFKATTTLRWIEGYTYPYTKKTPYFPIITLFDNALRIKDSDSPTSIRKKIERNLRSLLKNHFDLIPYIGSLYSLDYPVIKKVSPEFFKTKLFDAVYDVLLALAKNEPTIICIEDLHWADPSSLELIRFISLKIDAPVLFLYITRPVIEIFSDSQINEMQMEYQKIMIEDLSTDDSKKMVNSLLDTQQIPPDLESFIETQAQGNPFYLEEIINSLMESKILVKTEGNWQLNGSITEAEISSSIRGVISGRVDRLEADTRRILQEASVIGRSFYYKIIDRITETKKEIQTSLSTLEGLDLIKSKQSEIDLEYMFKHALTQEVVYKGLLKAQRRIIHEKIGIVIEQVFHDRLSEFYETLAAHFSRGTSRLKAVDYLVKSGEKSIRRYSLDESYNYFQKAYNLIGSISNKDLKTTEIMVDLLIRWALVFYYRGSFKELERLFFSNAHLVGKMDDNEAKGMFIAIQGFILEFTGQYAKAEVILKNALELGVRINSVKVIGYASTWLAWVYGDLGNFKEGIKYGRRAVELKKEYNLDHYVYFKGLAGVGWNYFCMGYPAECIEIGDELIRYGSEHAQVRSYSQGYNNKCFGYSHFGDLEKAVASGKKAVESSLDPLYKFYFTVPLSFACIQNDDMKGAEECLGRVMPFIQMNHDKYVGDISLSLKGVVEINKGMMAKGFEKILECERLLNVQKRKGFLPLIRFMLGRVYFEIVQNRKPLGFFTLVKNIGFISRHAPGAYKKAIYWYSKTIDLADETGATGIKAQALFDLGRLHRLKNKNILAIEHLDKAITIFEEIQAYAFLKQAKEERSLLNT